jgi:hypothetical protein
MELVAFITEPDLAAEALQRLGLAPPSQAQGAMHTAAEDALDLLPYAGGSWYGRSILEVTQANQWIYESGVELPN